MKKHNTTAEQPAQSDPASLSHPPQTALNPSDMARLLAAAFGDLSSRDKTCLLAQLFCGLRPDAITWEKLQRAMQNSKGRNPRFVQLPPDLVCALQALWKRHHQLSILPGGKRPPGPRQGSCQ